MSSIRFEEFDRILRELNPNLRTFPSRTYRSSMIYLRNSNHPDASGRHHLNEVLAYPSPSHGAFPKYDFLDKAALPGRGYTTVFKLLVRRRLINKDRLRALLPQALDSTRGRPQRKVEKDAAPFDIPVHAAPVRATRLRVRRNTVA